jgi:hypothetical protein
MGRSHCIVSGRLMSLAWGMVERRQELWGFHSVGFSLVGESF